MKIKTSMKYVANLYARVFYCGYCDLQDIFHNVEPTYYNAGVYGWNCDIYTDYAHNMAITTGYRNMRGDRIPDEIIKKYSDIAKNIIQNHTPYDETQEKLNANRNNFLAELATL